MGITPQQFWLSVQALVDKGIARVAPVRATVVALPSGMVQVQRLGNDTADAGKYARLEGFGFSVNDDILCLQHKGQLVPIGVLQTSVPSGYALDAPLTVAGAGTFTALNTPLLSPQTQSSADTASSTDTGNLVDVAHSTIALGVGTWTVSVWGGVSMIHSASGSARVAVNADGTDGALKIPPTLSSTVYSLGVAHDSFAGVAGNRSITYKLRGRPNTAGTLTFQNPFVIAFAQRTA